MGNQSDSPARAKCCGTCQHYRAHPQVLGMGQCWWGPPQMMATMQNGAPGLIPVRPVVSIRELPCGQWTATLSEQSKPAPSGAEVQSKLTPSQAEGSLK